MGLRGEKWRDTASIEVRYRVAARCSFGSGSLVSRISVRLASILRMGALQTTRKSGR
jgi:hypothetical protein